MKNENAPLSRHIELYSGASLCIWEPSLSYQILSQNLLESAQDDEKVGGADQIRTDGSRFCRPLDASIESEACARETIRFTINAPYISQDNPNQQTRGSAGIDTNAGHDCGGTVREIPGFRAHGSLGGAR